MARYEEVHVERPTFGRPEPEHTAVIDLRGVASTVWQHRIWVAVTTALCGVLALVAALMLPNRYEATAKVLLDPRDLQVLQNELNPTAGNGDETELFIQSQLQVVRSTGVLESVVDTLHLEQDPDFGRPAQGLVGGLSEALFGPAPPPSHEVARARSMRALDRDITVRRPDKTFVIDISATTGDADRSATIANTVADTFLKAIARARAENVERSAASLDSRLDQLRAQLRMKEQAVERYRAGKGLIDASGQLVGQQQFTDLNNQLALAQAKLAEQASRLGAVQNLLTRGDEPDAATDAQFANLSTLRAALAAARRAKAQAATVYGPRYPGLSSLDLAVSTARQQLETEMARIIRGARTDYERARAAETSLEQRIATLKRTVSVSNEDGVGLRELEREASASRTLYETFLNRARDLQERQSLDVINARVITLATPPLNRSGPSRVMVLVGGLLLGFGLGLGLALARGQCRW
jgi:uncharacterized protein involved in exopolysaccharide biosynthesis